MPHADPAVRAAYRKQYNQAHRDTRRQQHMDLRHQNGRPFVGVDGEGGNVGLRKRHEYLLLRAGSRVLETGRPLGSRECMEFLADLPSGVNYVSYFFTYDVTMILRDIPAMYIRYLMDREKRTNPVTGHGKPVQWDHFRFDWLPGKEFRIARINPGQPLRWVVIDDVGAFFQCTFVKALERWDIGSEALRARIQASKAKRSGFEHVTKLTRLYNKKECDLLADLMTEFRDVVGSVGPYPRSWQGPGTIAAAWLTHHKVPHVHNVPYDAMSTARDAYYGGRFEITAVGVVRRPIYQYDINSAYPAVIRDLPCLTHGKWKPIENGVSRRKVYVANVEFYHTKSKFLGTLPVRNQKGNISYPRTGSGTYWGVEILAARKAGCQITIIDGWEYVANCKCKPLDWINEVYALRQRVGKSKKGNALKLALNSIYGKFAQSIGHPKWANPVWAGLITATTRAQIIDACREVDDKHILMIATDGVFSDVPLNVPQSKKLGEWELTEHEWMFIIQPGLYLLPHEAPKTRGVPRVKIEQISRDLLRMWNSDLSSVTVVLTRFLAIRQAISMNKYSSAGIWYDEPRQINFDWSTKRSTEVGYWEKRAHANQRGAYRPAIREGGEASIPYAKSVGLWERDRMADEDQPEGAEVMS